MEGEPPKQLLNNPEQCVKDMLQGVGAVHPELTIDTSKQIVLLARNRKNRVALLSGGGAGHEPFSAGFVGEGMLTAAVSGEVFTSPPSGNIFSAIRALGPLNKGGVLCIVLNYTGDVLNFGLAVEQARAEGEQVNVFVMGDDCANLTRDMYNMASRRGMSGMVFAIKIAGALSTSGCGVEEIITNLKAVRGRTASIGASFKTCTIPGRGPAYILGPNAMEMGVGIHGESGVKQMKMCSAQELAAMMIDNIVDTMLIEEGHQVCVIVNNLGSVTEMEMYIFAYEVKTYLVSKGYEVARVYLGRLVTSLDMGGVQVALIDTTDRAEWIEFLDLPTEAFGWPGTKLSYKNTKYEPVTVKLNLEPRLQQSLAKAPVLVEREAKVFRECITTICKAFKKAEKKLNFLDTGCGDADCGTTFRRFADHVASKFSTLPSKSPQQTFAVLSQFADKVMGGTSGALYALFFLGLSRPYKDWSDMFTNGVDSVVMYSGAKLGLRSMMDALIPAWKEFKRVSAPDLTSPNPKADFIAGLRAGTLKAHEGCEETANMLARVGRAAYVDPAKLHGVDAGAFAVVIWMTVIHNVIIPNDPLPLELGLNVTIAQ